ncbi:hypothetical protein AYO21_06458 [Fonsecaea monophora]|uniref:Uncharacterized protein n=1 Tax=Fonsecaea monophora TaxID=254056 RepID=A0A177F4S3_9EURO|nr:hypothetical protein AYO21_06458 [Fonsecaea monophora]OAG39254.1 hypothetical protein AYO21_06458 [Fonsecaea monophora]
MRCSSVATATILQWVVMTLLVSAMPTRIIGVAVNPSVWRSASGSQNPTKMTPPHQGSPNKLTKSHNSVHGPRPGVEGPPEEIYSILQPQEMLSHPFARDPRLGVSWKLWRTDVENTSPVQFEWNMAQRVPANLGGLGAYVGTVAIKHAFKAEGMSLAPEVVEGNCVPLHCAPREEYCTASYNVHNDWGQQHDCGEAVDLKSTLCG